MSYPSSVNPPQIRFREAFDRHAESYDRRFSNHVLGESVRHEVWKIADRTFSSARRLLDLGCGTGEDAVHFAARGVQVTAVDVSPQMLNHLQAKALAAGVDGNIEYVASEMRQFCPAPSHFDGIISDFGALNCVADLNWLSDLAQQVLSPGSCLVLTTMGVFYPLESAAFLFRRQFRDVLRRLQSPCMVSVEGISLPVYYHSLGKMRRMLGARFQLEQVIGLRAFLPVPGWEHVSNSNRSSLLDRIDGLWCRCRWTASYADHFVTVWRYRP